MKKIKLTLCNPQPVDTETWLRLQLITAMDGDVAKAQIALDFVKGNPNASEEYHRFREWETEKYREYCRRKGIICGTNPQVEP